MAQSKVIGPKGGQKMAGVVESLSMRDDSEYGSITVRHGPKPKKDKEGMTVGPYPRTTHLDLPKGEVEKYKLGQKVEVRVVPSSPGGGGQVRV